MTTSTSKKTAVLALLVAASACTKNQPAAVVDTGLGPRTVATINGTPLPESVFNYYSLAIHQKKAEELTPEERGVMMEELINITLMSDAAKKEGLLDSRTVAAQMELNRLRLTAQLAAQDFFQKNPITDDEIKKVYDQNLPRFAGKEYKARHILVPSEDEANKLIEQLRKGKNFAALAQEHASGPTGPNGGDLGWFSADSMIAPIVEAVNTMTAGAYSTQPVKSDVGYHVLLLEDTRPRVPPTLESMHDEIVDALQRSKLDGYIKMLREGATVTPAPGASND
jgi:peptidyl-prolyl cis-trans isomerase C